MLGMTTIFFMLDCIFCKIINNEIPCHKVYEDKEVLAFLDINPIVKGHTVVIPKIHVETLLNLPDEKIKPLFLAIKKITQQIKNKLNPEAFNIGINMGKKAGQVVDHLHVHIIPRWQNDGGKSVNSIVNNPPKENLEDILERIVGTGL